LAPFDAQPHEQPDRDLFADLVERVARQDRDAFRALFDWYAPRVKGYIVRLGAEPSLAEELMQEVMVAVWRKASSFDRAQASASTWIYRIARNRRIDAFRRDRRAADLDADDPTLLPAAPPAPDEEAFAVDRETRIREALLSLPPEQRELVRRHFYEDLTHSEIAELTGLPLGTVKSRLRLAFAKLRGKLVEDL
jgi:RNA polymerase sigma-70 factor (ECF subfamily)